MIGEDGSDLAWECRVVALTEGETRSWDESVTLAAFASSKDAHEWARRTSHEDRERLEAIADACDADGACLEVTHRRTLDDKTVATEIKAAHVVIAGRPVEDYYGEECRCDETHGRD